ncbi:MAG TPA: phosphatidylserine/phosphatidylglycerophosphate/cardiolipin synthase family protein [Pantanalinema sp.]
MNSLLAPSKPRSTTLRPVQGGNAVRNAFTDADSLQGLLTDIKGAKRKIQFETFLLNGADGQAVVDALITQHQAGVKVQVLMDEGASALDKNRLYKQLKSAGIDARFLPKIEGVPYSVDHTKLSVIDDRIVWAGGANFDKENNRDMMSRIEGPAVADFQDTFDEGWKRAGGTKLSVARDASVKGDVWVGVSQNSAGENSARTQVLGELKLMGKGDAVDVWMMDLADPAVVDALLEAKARGAAVRVLLDQSVPFTSGGFADPAIKAIAGGIPDLGAIPRLQEAGIDVRRYVRPEGVTKLHSKVWIFTEQAGKQDETRRVIGGSVNAIKGAYDFNHELGFLMYGGGVGADVKAAFEQDLARHSEPVPPLSTWEGIKAKAVGFFTRHLI